MSSTVKDRFSRENIETTFNLHYRG